MKLRMFLFLVLSIPISLIRKLRCKYVKIDSHTRGNFEIIPLNNPAEYHDVVIGPCSCGAWHTEADGM